MMEVPNVLKNMEIEVKEAWRNIFVKGRSLARFKLTTICMQCGF